MKHEDLLNLLQSARSGLLSGATVITAGSREELLEKVAEAIDANEEDQEAERLLQVAEAINAERAAVFAGAALMAAAREFEQGHYQHAQIKVDAADTWTSLGDLLFRLEERREANAEKIMAEASLSAMFAKEEERLAEYQRKQAEQDAAQLREEASSGTPAE